MLTFYRTPFQNIVKGWHNKTPQNFRFVCKGSRYITHIQRLRTSHQSLDKFFSPLKWLDEKLILILWQLPPGLKRDLPLIKEFLALVYEHPQGKRLFHAIEFRNNSWFRDEVFELLETYHTGFCWYDAPKDKLPPTPTVSTGSIIYLRFHGKKQLYKGKYSEDDLKIWAEKINSQKGIRFCFVFFNNDYDAAGAFNAVEFKKILSAYLTSS